MTAKEVVRDIMQIRGWSQSRLAMESGMKGQTNINGILNRGASLRVDILERMVNAMGCEIVIRDKMGSRKEWVVHEIQSSES